MHYSNASLPHCQAATGGVTFLRLEQGFALCIPKEHVNLIPMDGTVQGAEEGIQGFHTAFGGIGQQLVGSGSIIEDGIGLKLVIVDSDPASIGKYVQ